MRLILLLALFLSTVSASKVYSQFAQNTEKKYKEAVEYYHKGDYAQAISLLAPLTQAQQKSSSISPYAHYYYALANIKEHKFQEGYLMIRQLIERFPSWDKIQEAYYLQGLVLFERKMPNDALKSLQKVTSSAMLKKVAALKQEYLSTEKNVQLLQSLYQQYPEDKEIAYALLQRIQEQKVINKEHLALSTQIVHQFGKSTIPPSSTEDKKPSQPKETGTSSFNKEHLNVAVLLPFRLDQISNSNHLKNAQYVIDYYQGLQLAQKQLAKEGIKVHLLPYDISNDPQQLQGFYASDKTMTSDLVIGPLYPKTYEEIVKYSKRSNAYVVNPFATDANLIDPNGRVYLAHPSMQLQAREMAEFTADLGGKLSIAVYYGTSAKDSSMAAIYVSQIKAKKGEIIELQKIGTTAEEINTSITISETRQPTYVALFSSSSSTGAALMNILSGRKLAHIKVISVASAFNFQQNNANFGQRLYIADPDFADLSNVKIRQFQHLYFDATNTLPSVFSYQGYDQLLFFGRKIHKYQDKLEQGLDRYSTEKDYLLPGFDYSKGARENMRFPILENHGGQWSQVN